MITIAVLTAVFLIAIVALVGLIARRRGTATAQGRCIEADRTSRTRGSAGVYSVHAHSPWPGTEENSRYFG